MKYLPVQAQPSTTSELESEQPCKEDNWRLDKTDLTAGDVALLQAIVDKLAESLREKNRSVAAWSERDAEKTERLLEMIDDRRTGEAN